MRMSTDTSKPRPVGVRWLVLVHQLRPKPDYLRVKIGRRLRALGAVPIKNSVYLFPASPESRSGVDTLVKEIQRAGERAVVWEARFLAGLSDDAAEDLFREAHDREYAAIAELARRLEAATKRRRGMLDPARRRAAAQLARIQRRFREVAARDHFGARSRDGAAGLLSLLEDRLQGVEQSGKPAPGAGPPHGATWVTRTGVMVDRIASAWLIRRFIDPEARFKFVTRRHSRPLRGELRFDMAGAEFTHGDGRCTFEVLVERFQLRDSALQPIAEIVHDLDLEDRRFRRPETAGVGRMIVGLAIACFSDESRLQQGGAVFDNLYQSFRRGAES
jgi:hypothetical protein